MNNSNDETVEAETVAAESTTTEPKPKRHRRKTSPRAVVRVTEDLIATAIPKDSGHCMVADAIKVAFPTAKLVAVDLQTIRFSDPEKGLRYIYLTHGLAQAALIDFDEGIRPHPFQFEIGRAVQILSMFRNPGRRGEPRKSAPVHDLGPKRWQREKGVGTIIGGAPLPTMRAPAPDTAAPDRPNTAEPDKPDTVAADRPNTATQKTSGQPATPRRLRRRREFGLRLHKTGRDILISGSAA